MTQTLVYICHFLLVESQKKSFSLAVTAHYSFQIKERVLIIAMLIERQNLGWSFEVPIGELPCIWKLYRIIEFLLKFLTYTKIVYQLDFGS